MARTFAATEHLTHDFSWWIAPLVALAFVCLLAALCHVDPHVHGDSLYVAFCGFLHTSWALGLVRGGSRSRRWRCGMVVARAVAAIGNCIEAARAVAGMVLAWSPFVVHAIGVKLKSLRMCLRYRSGSPRLEGRPQCPDGLRRDWEPSWAVILLRPETVLIGQGVAVPASDWPMSPTSSST